MSALATVATSSSRFDRVCGAGIRGAAYASRYFHNRGLGLALRTVRTLRRGHGDMTLTLAPDSRFTFPLGDLYWSRLLNRRYEPEIEWLLRRATDLPYALIDCGANMGYWSILASSARYGGHFAVAIEAARSNFERLCLNREQNGARFAVLHRAVSSCSGATVDLFGSSHQGRSLSDHWHADEAGTMEQVETIGLDDAAKIYVGDWKFPPLVKLDIEGAETDALKSGEALLGAGALVIYEDHLKDPTHRVSARLLARENFAVWYLRPDRSLARMRSLADIADAKRDPAFAYNFFGVSSASPWSRIFQQAVHS